MAELLGHPFAWTDFTAHAARIARKGVPSENQFDDSLRALAVCQTGKFAGNQPLEVWTSDHIDNIVRQKATHPLEPDSRTGYAGLGWGPEFADSLVDDLVGGLVSSSHGDSIGYVYPDSEPPLDHEDGLVYGACRALVNHDPLAHVYCVTNDRGFLTDYREGRLSGHAIVLTPVSFLQLVRKARAMHAQRSILGPSSRP